MHSSRARTENGSNRKMRIALRWVILSTSASVAPDPSNCFMTDSGEYGQLESE